MNAAPLFYLAGGEVHAGDRVRYKGNAANVAFVSDGDEGEFSLGFEDYHGNDPGIMLVDDDGEETFITEPTEELEFVHRKDA